MDVTKCEGTKNWSYSEKSLRFYAKENDQENSYEDSLKRSGKPITNQGRTSTSFMKKLNKTLLSLQNYQ